MQFRNSASLLCLAFALGTGAAAAQEQPSALPDAPVPQPATLAMPALPLAGSPEKRTIFALPDYLNQTDDIFSGGLVENAKIFMRERGVDQGAFFNTAVRENLSPHWSMTLGTLNPNIFRPDCVAETSTWRSVLGTPPGIRNSIPSMDCLPFNRSAEGVGFGLQWSDKKNPRRQSAPKHSVFGIKW